MSEPHDSPEVVHEESDVNVRAILGFGIGLLIVGLVVHLALAALFGFFNRRAEAGTRAFPLTEEQQAAPPPEPRLQTHPQEDLRELRAREDEQLNTYGWVDKPNGIARIPIEQAMKLTVARGLAHRSAKREGGGQ